MEKQKKHSIIITIGTIILIIVILVGNYVWDRTGGNGSTSSDAINTGEEVGNEVRSYMYWGELGNVSEPYKVNCTSILHKVVMGEK